MLQVEWDWGTTFELKIMWLTKRSYCLPNNSFMLIKPCLFFLSILANVFRNPECVSKKWNAHRGKHSIVWNAHDHLFFGVIPSDHRSVPVGHHRKKNKQWTLCHEKPSWEVQSFDLKKQIFRSELLRILVLIYRS